jgi:hypothetical protein
MRFLQSSDAAARWPPGESCQHLRWRFATPRSSSAKCNLSAAALSRARACAFAGMLMFSATQAVAQSTTPSVPAQPDGNVLLDSVKFLAGGALGLTMHEGAHLVFDAAFDAHPHVERVHFGPFPFFAISHRSDLSPRREFTISSAGIWAQEATNEWLLTRRPQLRHEHAWLTKGVLGFNVLTSVGYAMVAFAKAGPVERDTRGMADSIGVDERAIGLIVLAPAVLDAYRYFRPESRWAAWVSRGVKAGSVVLVIKGR